MKSDTLVEHDDKFINTSFLVGKFPKSVIGPQVGSNPNV